MDFLKNIFSPAAAPVTLPRAEVEAVFEAPAGYTQDNDYTDYVFRTLRIGRIHHLMNATTHCYLTRPEQTFDLARTNDYHEDISFPGSPGVFISTYKTLSGEQGLGILVRDRIKEVAQSQPDSHVILGFKGTITDDEVAIHYILTAEFNQRGRIMRIKPLPVTPDNASRMLLCAAMNIDQMTNGKPLTAAVNKINAWSENADARLLKSPSRAITPRR